MTRTVRTRGRPRSTEADDAILEAAVELLIERGVEATSIERVANRAGVTRPTVYRRYTDKTTLLIAAIHHAYPAPPDQLPVPRDTEEMLAWWARGLGGDTGDRTAGRTRQLLRRLMISLHDHPELEEAFTEASIEPRNRWIRAVLARDRERGRFPADTDLEIVQQILTGAVTTHLLTRPDDSSPQEIEEFLLAVLRATCYRKES
ncbi:TetR/AcrR family transcriptional regulator [Nocardia carnea]|uniref:TetR/AcrR family transcriptional regulator n=1 Tax=Nocardia carnea TaxID=37328 RepID=UPI00245634E0|nr:TetR/AcrR family transcriptional regulator [Nocardia carnea]